MSVSETVTVEDLELSAEGLDPIRAAGIFKAHGCLVVRGLMAGYVEAIGRDIEATAAQSIALLDRAEEIPEGWRTADGTLFLPAPENFERDKQIMVLAINYQTSAAFFRSAFGFVVLAPAFFRYGFAHVSSGNLRM